MTFAYSGCLSAILFFLFPVTPQESLPLAAAFLAIIGNVAYATAAVCSNSFLPGLAREEKDVLLAAAEMLDDGRGMSVAQEAQGLLASAARADLNQDLSTPTSLKAPPSEDYATLLSLSTSRLSSTNAALGFLSGLLMLVALMMPVTMLHSSTASLQIAVGLCGLWWAVFAIPASFGLPTAGREQAEKGDGLWFVAAWVRVGRMVRWSEMKSLPNLYIFLLAWIFLSDGWHDHLYARVSLAEMSSGFHTMSYTAILYASSTLQMSANKIIIIGILTQLVGG